MDEIIYWSARELAAAIRAKELSSREVIEAHLRRIDEVNPRLNAVVQLTATRALEEADQCDADLACGKVRGPLHGVPITVKDSLCTKDVITTAGTPGLKRFRPKQDATAVARMRAAGAILLGKTNLTELCGSGESDNEVYGRTNNPYDLTRTPGGSSGGEVAIIAAGGSPLGLGSDSGGSIRGPCHMCGIAGLNPTMGRVPRTGHIPPYGGAFDTARIGPMARFVKDLTLALPIIAGVDGIDPTVIPMTLDNVETVEMKNLRVAFYTDNGIFPVTPETVNVVKQTAQALSDTVLVVVEDRPDVLKETMEISDGLYSAIRDIEQRDLFPVLTEPMDRDPASLSQYTERWWQRVRAMVSEDTVRGVEFLYWTMRWSVYCSSILSFLQNYDVIICPVDAYPAQPHGFTTQDNFRPEGLTSYTKPYSLAGLPSAVVRGGDSSENLPVGVQVVARLWREDVALTMAECIETTLGGWRRPQI